ncbi:MAG: AMP-binding protein [Oscillospiraceae bacterium]|jgi:long-chain acyl-CoA synthetase|nr:AMP-binding protein [Oscillospiraceae bacterium]
MRNKAYPWNENIPWMTSFPEFLAFIEQAYARRDAFVFERGGASVSVTYAQFLRDVYALAAALRAQDWAGKHYVLMGETSYEWILFFFAGILNGAVAVALDKDLPLDEQRTRLALVDTDILLYSADYADVAAALDAPQKLCFTQTAGLLAEGAVRTVDRRDFVPDKEAPAAIFFTSGTSGMTKGATLSAHNLIYCVCAASRNFWEEGMNLLVLPLHHCFGVVAALLSPLAGGSTSALCPSVKRVKHFLSKYPPDCIFGVPLVVESVAAEIWRGAAKQKKTALLKAMLALSNTLQKIGIDVSKQLLGSVRRNFGGRLKSLVSGGGDLNPNLFPLFRGLGVNLLNGYGLTESASTASINRNHHWRDGSVGLPLFGTEVRIAPDGEIQLRGEHIFLGYYNNPEETQAVFTEDGWFRSGDLGYLDDDGFLFMTGRKKNLIILSNGENVSPEWLEAKLQVIDAAQAVLVYAEGEQIVAEFYLGEGGIAQKKTLEDAVDAVNRKLPLYAQIAQVKIRDEDFVRNTAGKIIRK